MKKYTVIHPEAHVTRQLYKLPRIVDNDLVKEPDGIERLCYEVAICPQSLDDLAKRAAGNLRQAACNGPLRVRILSTQPLTATHNDTGGA